MFCLDHQKHIKDYASFIYPSKKLVMAYEILSWFNKIAGGVHTYTA